MICWRLHLEQEKERKRSRLTLITERIALVPRARKLYGVLSPYKFDFMYK